MRISPLAAALAVVFASIGGPARATSVIELQTPNAQATKFSENGQYLVSSVFGQGGVLWTADSGVETPITALGSVMGINNQGVVAGATYADGGYDNGGHDLPALLQLDGELTSLPLPTGTDNVNVYDVSDDGVAVGLAWSDDYSVAKAYYYSPKTGVGDLPVDNTTSASRGNVISADGSIIGGWSDDPDTGFRRGVVWTNLVPTYLQDGDGYDLGEVDGISGNGQWIVAGGYRMNLGSGELTPIPSMPLPFGISDDGKMIVGASGFFDNPPRALLIWTEAGGTEMLSDYLVERGVQLPADLPTPWQGGLTAVSGDSTKVAGWLYGTTGMLSIVVDDANALPDRLFSDGFDPPPPPPIVTDGSFEETDGGFGPNPNWDASDTNSEGTDFASGGVPTHDGIYALWLGGWGGANPETQTIAQTLTMPASGPQYLNYWRYAILLPDLAGTMVVTVDGNVVETTDFSALAGDSSYVQQSIDISSYADGGQHTIQFQYDYPGGGDSDGNVFIDDISIDATATPDHRAFGHYVSRADGAKLRKRAKR